ncbi:ABC transporter ATP-binding protein [Enteractinococcus fodinae]|uniref:ABC transporter ATP-binding protein n=1 Tax=Enteractinococcus fodinae TaxID=684663 RepID=UPI0038995FC4
MRADKVQSTNQTAPLLEVRDLHVEFRTKSGVVQAVNGLNFTLEAGQTLAILGESGSGKSVTAQAIMGILDIPPGNISGGQILFHGEDLLTMPEERRRRLRGRNIAMIFQDALSALNPVYPVGWQIAEMFRVHHKMNRKQARERAIQLMQRVGIPAAEDRVGDYPHEFSGGMRQRIMIAMAIALDPELLIADEPTTALDVTVQAQVMKLLKDLQDEFTMGMILITHDLGVVADVADEIAVMYAGQVMEASDVFEIYRHPSHPYTQGLLDSIPRIDGTDGRLRAIEGLPPKLTDLPPGCLFQPRCPMATELCVAERPGLLPVIQDHVSACHYRDQLHPDATQEHHDDITH